MVSVRYLGCHQSSLRCSYLFPIEIKCKVYDNQVAINILSEEYNYFLSMQNAWEQFITKLQ